MVSAQDELALFFGVAVGLWVFTAAPTAAGTEIALVAIVGQAIAGEAVAAAVNTFNCHHTGEFIVSP